MINVLVFIFGFIMGFIIACIGTGWMIGKKGYKTLSEIPERERK